MRRTHTLSLVFALASAAVAVSAQTRPPAPQGSEDAEEIVVLGVRPARLERDVSAFRDVLLTDDFEGEGQDLPDLLARQAGVFVRRFGGPGDPSEVSIRGSSASQVVVTVNGVRINSALSGGVDLSLLCIPFIEEVAITRGGGGAREGSGAIGGVLDLRTRAAGPAPETRASFEAGAFETFEGAVFRSDRVGDLGMSLGYCGMDTEGDFQFARPEFRGPGAPVQFVPGQTKRINNQSSHHAGTLSLGHPLGPGELQLLELFHYDEGGEPGIDCCADALAGQNPRARGEDLRNLAQLRWQGTPGGAWGDALDALLYHRHEDSRFHDPVQLLGGRVNSRTRLDTLGLRVDPRWVRATDAGTARLGLGLDASQDLLQATRRTRRARTRVAGLLDAELGFARDRVRVVGALRADWANEFDLQWIPSLGLVVTPLDWLRLRANGGRSYRFPSFDELYLPDEGFQRGNPRLSPEDAWQVDLGGEILLEALGPLSDLSFSAAWFRREIDEQILWVRISSSTVAPINTGDATAEGIEFALDFGLTRFLYLFASHTELESRRDATGRRLPGQPERETAVRVRLGPETHWKLVGEMLRTGEILVAEGGGERLPARTVWNASLGFDLAQFTGLAGFDTPLDSLWIYFALDNIGDEAVRDSLAFPQPGRQASAGFQARW